MKYPVKDRVEHDGKLYEPGSCLEIDEAIAAPLLAMGVIGEPTGEEPGKASKPKKDQAPAPAEQAAKE